MKPDNNENPFNNNSLQKDIPGANREIAAAESPRKKAHGKKEKPMIDEQINHSLLVRQIEE